MSNSNVVYLNRGLKWPASGKPGPQFVKKILPWVESFWHTNKRYPTDGELSEHFGFNAEQLTALRVSKFYNECLRSRGISQVVDFFTPEQVASITLITNFADTRPLDVKLASIGVTAEQYNGWLANPSFKRELSARADDILDNIYPEAQAMLARHIKKGNFQALKFYFEVTGRAQSPDIINLKITMSRLIEAVEKHVKDPEILKAISNEIKGVVPEVVAPEGPVASIENPTGSIGQSYRDHLKGMHINAE